MPRTALLLLPLIVLPSCQGESEIEPPPHVLVVTIDTLRADHLGLYGYFRDTSPTLDALAEESLVFEQCLVHMATTLPSHVSLFTATQPLENGVLANLQHGGKSFAPGPGLQSMAQAFRAEGYATAAFVSCSPLKRTGGLHVGFDVYEQPKRAQLPADKTTERALAWISAQPEDRPYFLWVHYFDAHTPYLAPAAFEAMFTDGPDLDAYLEARKIPATSVSMKNETVNTREATNAYDAEIRFLDSQFKVLLQAVGTEALVLVVGDHGEGLGQHGSVGHGEIWEEQLRVLLLMRVPGQAPERIRQPIAMVDVWPTLMGVSDLQLSSLDRRQWSGLDRWSERNLPIRILSMTTARHLPEGASEQFTLVTEDWKLVRTAGAADRLYSRSADPHELTDVALEHQEVLSKLGQELAALLQVQRERSGNWGESVAEDLSEAQLQELRDLGYLGDADSSE